MIEWMHGPRVIESDRGVAFTEDGIWTVTYDGGPHCPVSDMVHGYRCGRPVGHDGKHSAVAGELIDQGVRLHPVASLATNPKENR